MLDLIIEGTRPQKLAFDVKKMINAGLSNRDQAGVRRHLDEAAKEGIKYIFEQTPAYLPKVKDRITTGDIIEVLPNSKSSGEAEPVVLVSDNNEIYIAVGSDHSDRELEKYDMILSKHIYPNVMSKRVWRFADVKGHWDDIILRGWVIDADGKRQLYQENKVGEFMGVEQFLDEVRKYFQIDLNGLVMFMGTFPTLGGKLIITPGFEAQLVDEKLKRTLTCSYITQPMAWFKYGPHTPKKVA